MANSSYTYHNNLSVQHTADPGKKNNNAEEIVNSEEETIVNSEEDLVSYDKPVVNQNDGSIEKQRGFKEGNKDDYLNEPELKDSDGQLEFPDEEG
jgi:hypothetical protein